MSDFEINGKLVYFLDILESIEDALPSLKKNLLDEFNNKKAECESFIEAHAKEIERKEDGKISSFLMHRSKTPELRKLRKERDKSRKLLLVIPTNFLVAIVSEYDAFIGDLIREIYKNKPEKVNSLEKEFTFKEIIEFGSMESIKDFVIEKDIETTLRKSHLEQLNALERKFTIDLTKDLSLLPDFIEITERRNLFVQCKGIVSSQYIKNCSENGVKLNDLKIGNRLYATNSYIFHAIDVFSELAIKLTHVLWNKVFKEDSEKIGDSIHDISYELLSRKKYELLNSLSPLFLSKPFSSIGEGTRRALLVNHCIALIERGQKDASDKLLDSYDWSASSPILQMAERILKEDYKRSTVYMKQAYQMDVLKKEHIDQWPLFMHFKNSDEFKSLYDELFGKDETINVTISEEDIQSKEAEAEAEAQVQAQATLEAEGVEDGQQTETTSVSQPVAQTESEIDNKQS
ncbi:hypothetical protein [Cronobacter sakazakii]|uniref:hypothetical protein n=2 Tax=Enterobacteriaceae TaxID=543 RepID=UPI00294B0594|nr:hypothetical protein [Cronobacter sakazakii]